MPSLQGILYFLAMVPITAWQQNNGDFSGYLRAIVAVLVFWVLPLATVYLVIRLLLAAVRWLVATVHWRRHRQQCQHCQAWTLSTSQQQYDNCDTDLACCKNCQALHRAANEDCRRCPKDDSPMTAITYHANRDLDAYQCGECGATLLDKRELEMFMDETASRRPLVRTLAVLAFVLMVGMAIGVVA